MTKNNAMATGLASALLVTWLGATTLSGCQDKRHSSPHSSTTTGRSTPSSSSSQPPRVQVDSDEELGLDQAVENLKKRGWQAELEPETVKKEDRRVVMFISKARIVIVIARYDDIEKAKAQYTKINGSKHILAERRGHTLISVKCGGDVSETKCRKALRDVL